MERYAEKYIQWVTTMPEQWTLSLTVRISFV